MKKHSATPAASAMLRLGLGLMLKALPGFLRAGELDGSAHRRLPAGPPFASADSWLGAMSIWNSYPGLALRLDWPESLAASSLNRPETVAASKRVSIQVHTHTHLSA